MNTIVLFGAGNIGRSLVASLFHRAAWRIVFVDADPRIVDALNQRETYAVEIREPDADPQRDRIAVGGFEALHVGQAGRIAEAVEAADLLATAVGGGALAKVVHSFAPGLKRRDRPVSVLLCENLQGAAAVAREALAAACPEGTPAPVGFVETSIGKMVPIMPDAVRQRDPLLVWAERYNRIVADRGAFVDAPPAVEGLVLKGHFRAHVACKLFVHNLGHAAAAYHGFLRGRSTIRACMDDARVAGEVRQTMDVSVEALGRAYPEAFAAGELAAHREDLLQRFGNPALGDTVFRVGRDLARKLGPTDRCVGALQLAISHGIDPAPVCRTLAAGLCFRATDEAGALDPRDAAVLQRLEDDGAEAFLRDHCRIGTLPDGERMLLEILHWHGVYANAP
jgi:mannitol-1-phosphate 5-dehydrogenase